MRIPRDNLPDDQCPLSGLSQADGKGEAQTFVCVCGHKEKMAAFEDRRKREGKDVSRQDVRRYMKQQQKEAEQPLNHAFAEAFAKIKLD